MFDKLTEKTRSAFFLQTGLHLDGNRELIVENCRRIEECSDVLVSLSCSGMTVNVWGNDLRTFDYKTGGLVVRGRISRIELEEK